MTCYEDMTPEDFFRTVAPEFADLTDAEIGIWLSVATAQISSAVWGDLYRIGVTYLAAHFASFSAPGGKLVNATGTTAITFERAGEVARNYAIPSGSEASASSNLSKYGKLHAELRKRLPGVKPITTAPNINWATNTRKY